MENLDMHGKYYELAIRIKYTYMYIKPHFRHD